MRVNNKRKFIISLVFSLFFLTFSCANFVLFSVHRQGGRVEFKIGYFAVAVIYSVLIFFLGGFRAEFSKRAEKTAGIIGCVLSVLGAMAVAILFSDGFDGDTFLFFLNVVFYMIPGGIALLISGDLRVSSITVLAVSYIYNAVSFIIYSFRGNSLMPTDFMAIGTAMKVASQYKFKLRYQLISATIMAVGHFMIAVKFPLKPEFKRKKIVMRLSGAVYTIIAVMLVTGINYDNYDVSVYDQHAANYEHGSAVGFYVNAAKMGLNKLDGYDPEHVDSKLMTYGENENDLSEKPNIIVIMNESFSDLRAVGEFETDAEYMPYFNSLKKNTIKGETLVSPFGGYTCNSEYEFLTGMNTGLLSSLSIPYMHMIKSELPYTLNTHLKQLGYKTIAMHPYYKSGWNRNIVYDYMGFDEFIGIDEFEDKEYLRSYVSDNSNYSAVLKRLYNKEPDERQFIFNITMQNHGGYEYEDFEPDVHITDMEGDYPMTEQYLTCIRHSDMALKALLTELKNFDEPVVVCMFGDHQPAVEEEFFEELYGADLDDLSDEELERRYVTPFMIWANYDIDERDDVKTSPSFLSNLVMEVANLPKSRVQFYLDDLRQEVAQLNPLGYYDNDGQWHAHEDCRELEHYYNIQYSLLNGENLNYDFVLYDREYDILENYVLTPKYMFKDESDAIIEDSKRR